MKRLLGCVMISTTVLLSACAQDKTPNFSTERSSDNTWTYVVDGVETPLEQIEELTSQKQLYYVVPQDAVSTVQVATSEEAFTDLRAHYKQLRQAELGTQQLFPCISIKTRTRIFDLDDYKGAKKKLDSNYYSLDLSNVNQSNPTPATDATPDWNNDINSVKGRDCRESFLMTDINFGGSMLLVQPGQHIDHLPYPFYNGVSSISID